MKNKKGWIKIVEASIAILIIIAVLVSVSQMRQKRIEKDLSESITPLLEEIAKNVTMREMILEDNDDSNIAENVISQFVEERLANGNIGYNVSICMVDEICGLEIYPDVGGNIYAGSRIVSSILTGQRSGPKKLSLFLWLER